MKFLSRTSLKVAPIALLLMGTNAFASESALNDFLAKLQQRGLATSVDNVSEAGNVVNAQKISFGAQDAAWTVSFNNAALTDLASKDGLGLSAAAITSGKLVIETAGASVDLNGFEAKQFSFDKLDVFLKSVADLQASGKTTEEVFNLVSGKFYTFLAGVEFETFKIANWTAGLKDKAKSPIKDMGGGAFTMTGMQAGILKSYKISDFRVAVEERPGRDTTFSIGEVSLVDYDIGHIAYVTDDANYKDGKGDGVMKAISGPGAMKNMAMAIEGGNIAIEAMEIGPMRLKQTPTPFSSLNQKLAGLGKVSPSGFPDMSSFKDLLPAISGIYGSFEFDLMRIVNLNVQPPKEKPVNIGEIAFENYSLDKGIGEIRVAGIEGAAPDFDLFKLGKFAIRGIEFPELSAVMASVEAFASGKRPSYATIAPFAPKLAEIGLSDATLRGTKDHHKIDLTGISLKTTDYVKAIPTKMQLTLQDFKANTKGLAELEREFGVIAALGYENLTLNGVIDLAWNEATSELSILPSKVKVTEMGEINLAGTFTGVPRALIEDPERGLALAAGIGVKSVDLSFTDASITNAALAFFAKQQGADPAAMRQQLLAMAAGGLAFLQNPGFQQKVSAALKTFSEKPGTLTVSAKPAEPLPVLGLTVLAQQAPGQLIDQLGLTIEAK